MGRGPAPGFRRRGRTGRRRAFPYAEQTRAGGGADARRGAQVPRDRQNHAKQPEDRRDLAGKGAQEAAQGSSRQDAGTGRDGQRGGAYSGRHYSNERLLAHLDGEMPGWERARLESPLGSCWSYRARRAALEQQIHRVADALEETGFPDEDWPVQQTARFRCRVALQADMKATPLAATRSYRPLYLAVAAAAVIAVVVFRTLPSAGGENAAAAQPLHQSFRVELLRESGQREILSGQLEIWSDPAGGSYSARLRHGGRLGHPATGIDRRPSGFGGGVGGTAGPLPGVATLAARLHRRQGSALPEPRRRGSLRRAVPSLGGAPAPHRRPAPGRRLFRNALRRLCPGWLPAEVASAESGRRERGTHSLDQVQDALGTSLT